MKRLYSFAAALLCVALSLRPAAAYGQSQTHNVNFIYRYAAANEQLPPPAKGERRVVFLGNSITEFWNVHHPEFFAEHGYICRGVSGQTSYEFLLRFREDVIALQPRVLVLNVGTNDIAENSCPYNEERTLGNIISMVELARAHRIKVILTSVLPHRSFGWKQIENAPQKVIALNERIKAYAKAHRLAYVDYHAAMVDTDGLGMRPGLSNDEIHPLPDAYYLMERLVEPAIKKAL